jgi:hypothetical protein
MRRAGRPPPFFTRGFRIHYMAQRQRTTRQIVPVEIMDAGGSRAKDSAGKDVQALCVRLGISEAASLALEAARREDVESVRGIVSDLRHVTSEAISLYSRRGFSVQDVGLGYERALGDRNFAGAEAFGESSTISDVASAAVSATTAAWMGLESAVGSQSQTRVIAKARGLRGKKEPEAAVIDEMREVWRLKAEELARGGRVEEVRSGLGLRTLNALLGRYRSADARGRDDAAPKAYMWAERAYWLTKHTVSQLFRITPQKSAELKQIGLDYEVALGDSGLAGSSGGRIAVGAGGWEVVGVAQEETAKAWRRMKGLIIP